MRKVKSSDVRIRHKTTGLYLLVENLGRSQAENDVYTKDSDDATAFKNKAEAIKVAKRLGLQASDFTIE